MTPFSVTSLFVVPVFYPLYLFSLSSIEVLFMSRRLYPILSVFFRGSQYIYQAGRPSPHKQALCPFAVSPFLPQPEATTHLFSVSINFAFLEISYDEIIQHGVLVSGFFHLA